MAQQTPFPSSPPVAARLSPPHALWLVGFLFCWLALVLGTVFFARELQTLVVWGWPLGYWMAAQGVVFGFIAIVGLYAWVMRRLDLDLEGSANQVPVVRPPKP